METDIFTILLFGVIIALIGAFLLISFETIFRLGQNLIEKNRAIEAEIIERKKAQAEIESSLKEKEVLLQEIHHRVKNNMQIVASLLQLQSRRIVDDPKTVAILNDSRSRVNAMSLIHETLYNPSNLSSVSLREYIKELALNLFDFYGVDPDRIALITDVESISLNIETATPCGLIINELVTNSLKYAFPAERQGVITLTMKRVQDGTGYLLQVADNGIGLPEDLDIRRTNSLGMQLVVNLTENQLQGRLEVIRHHGTTFRITFQEIGYTNRI
jgi:two-component sensor histidine kinase